MEYLAADTSVSTLITDGFSGITTTLGVVFVAAFALTGLVVGVRAGIKWVRRIGAS
jgi:hypothetical protein